MPQSKGIHHYHKRKRVHEKLEKYPHPNKWKRGFDKAVLIVGIITIIFSVPQITKIFLEKNATGVSLITWITFLVSSCFWFTYGVLHKEKPLIVTYAGWIVINILVVIGIVIYG